MILIEWKDTNPSNPKLVQFEIQQYSETRRSSKPNDVHENYEVNISEILIQIIYLMVSQC